MDRGVGRGNRSRISSARGAGVDRGGFEPHIDVAPDRKASRLQLTARDRDLLAFAAEHRFVLADQVRLLLGVTPEATDARLRALARAGLLERRTVFHRQPALNRITAAGVTAIGGDLKPPRLELHAYAHDVGVAWLWLAAHRGAFGPMQSIVAERRLRSLDARAEPGELPRAARLGCLGPRGQERLHYPDLLLTTVEGRRVAVELELTGKGRSRTERILGAYAADPRIDAVIYLVPDRRIGRTVAEAARRHGLSRRAHVQLVRVGGQPPRIEAGDTRCSLLAVEAAGARGSAAGR